MSINFIMAFFNELVSIITEDVSAILSQGIGGQKDCVGKGASLDYSEGMTKLACLQRMVL
jgi:hypothetical protein